MASERLINTTDELKAAMGAVQADLQFNAIVSFIDDAEQKHVIPAIGYGLYDVLLGDTLNTKQTRARNLLRKAIANFTIFYYSAFGAVQISESGIFVLKDERQLPASDKKLLLLRNQSRASAYEALEAAIIYLESNQADFPAYTADAAHAQNRSLYTNTTVEFEVGFNIGGNAEFFQKLRSVLPTVERTYIDTILGNSVTNALRAAILASNPSTPQQNLLSRIRACTSPLAIAEAVPYSLVSFGGGNAVTANLKSNSDNVEETAPADMARLQRLMDACLRKGLSAQAALTTWLDANAADFTGYVPSVAPTGSINDELNGIYYI